MLQKSDFEKMSKHSKWFKDVDAETRYLVGVTTNDKSLLPQWLKEFDRDVDGLKLANDPNYVVTEVNHGRLQELNDDQNVKSWGIIRKCGPVEFTDDQIWDAFIQQQREFSHSIKLFNYTREQYMEHDPIGYDECMAAMSRILYKALGYL